MIHRNIWKELSGSLIILILSGSLSLALDQKEPAAGSGNPQPGIIEKNNTTLSPEVSSPGSKAVQENKFSFPGSLTPPPFKTMDGKKEEG